MSIKDKLIITVSDVSGTKSYNINKIIRKVVIYVILILLIVTGLSFWIISNINTSLNVEIDKLSLQSKKLETQNSMLEAKNKLYNLQINDKVKDIEALSDTLKEIEEIIGVDGDDKVSLINRATLAKLTSAQKTYMLQTIPNGKPLPSISVTASFGWRIHPITKKKKYHNGIDLRAKRRTDVYATADGIVRYVQDKNKGNFGRMIILAHNFGFETVYAHLRFTHVKVGDVIKKGHVIGKTGNSGLSSGPHLHYEVRYASKVLNPRDFIRWDMTNYEKIFEKQRRVQWESLIKMISNQHDKLVQQ